MDEEDAMQEAVVAALIVGQLVEHVRWDAADDVDEGTRNADRHQPLAFAVDKVTLPGPVRQPELAVATATTLVLSHPAHPGDALVLRHQQSTRVVLQQWCQ